MATSGNAQHLHVKSFFAASVKEALAQAHLELGQDALVLKTRDAPLEARHLGACEVVLGVSRQSDAAIRENERLPSRSGGAIDEALVALKAFMRTLPAQVRTNPVEETLVALGMEALMAHEIEQAVQQRITRGPVVQMGRAGTIRTYSPQMLASETAAEIAGRIEVQPGIGRVTALVGPPGTGKTTTLVKLAVVEGLRARRSVRLISTDTHRVGGADQLRTFAAILGVPFQAVESSSALAQSIEAATNSDLVLIDTPGYSTTLQSELGSDLAAFLGSRQDIDTHLVLTASTCSAVLPRLVETYRPCGPAKMLFTRLDETESLASIYCEAVRQKLPLSYFSVGQVIPEDLEPASRERVAESLVRRLPEELRAIA
jgi:flagellar biosynthesis protein FlhF